MTNFLVILRLYVVLHVLLHAHACWEEEKIALLKLKDAFNYPNGTAFSYWGGEERDCCKWERVGCSELTKHVIKLSLYYTRQGWLGDFFLESSLFHPFEELHELRLDGNRIEGFNGVLRLKTLQLLDLRSNLLTEIPSLSGIESLKFFNFRGNYLKNFSTFPGLKTLRGLEMLDLSYNDIAGEMPPSLGAMTSLKSLSFSHNELNGFFPEEGPIPTELGFLSDIHTLNLSHNQLNGSIPRTFSNMKQIESLDLSNNNLSGEIPPDLVQLNFLSKFSVANNNLSGRAPDRKAQFATFDASNYEGNPFLCGLPLQENYRRSTSSVSDPNPEDPGETDDLFKDSFLETFVPSCVVAFLGVAAFIYFNSTCRMLWLFIEAKLSTSDRFA